MYQRSMHVVLAHFAELLYGSYPSVDRRPASMSGLPLYDQEVESLFGDAAHPTGLIMSKCACCSTSDVGSYVLRVPLAGDATPVVADMLSCNLHSPGYVWAQKQNISRTKHAQEKQRSHWRTCCYSVALHGAILLAQALSVTVETQRIWRLSSSQE
jgi:hypothetical protein